MSPLVSYIAAEILLLALLRLLPSNGLWFLLAGFLAIGFTGALVFKDRQLANSRALIVSSGIVCALFWAYIFASLGMVAIADPGIIPDDIRQGLRDNAAGDLLGALPNIAGAIVTSWMICLLLAVAGNTFGTRVRRLFASSS